MVRLRLGVPTACAGAGLMLDGFFFGPCAGRRFLVCSRLGVPAAFATTGGMLDLLFIFIDPCAARHLLSLPRQSNRVQPGVEVGMARSLSDHSAITREADT